MWSSSAGAGADGGRRRIQGDVDGALKVPALHACLVRTGKYQPGDEDKVAGEFALPRCCGTAHGSRSASAESRLVLAHA